MRRKRERERQKRERDRERQRETERDRERKVNGREKKHFLTGKGGEFDLTENV